jgi:SAM-dependent methyltransferase
MNKWDTRYNTEEYVFGKRPNRFLIDCAAGLAPGKALCLGEGEGRNAVYLASLGWEVSAVDISPYGIEKAQLLARQRGVSITTITTDLNDYTIAPNAWDLIITFFVHIPAEERARMHRKVIAGLRPGGTYILEGYSPEMVRFGDRGPKELPQRYHPETIRAELDGLELRTVRELDRLLDEAEPELGWVAVTQVLAVKPATGSLYK